MAGQNAPQQGTNPGKEMSTMSEELVRAAQYVRMSTEHQQYSTSNQMDVIREYAKKHGLEIVKVFSDVSLDGG